MCASKSSCSEPSIHSGMPPSSSSSPNLDFNQFALISLCECGRPGTFFSYTVTEEEISLVIDEDTVAAFPPDTLVLSPDHLRAIQVYEGAHAISAFSLYVCRSCCACASSLTLCNASDMTGYVSLLSGGITQEGINVIYFSTFNTDLLLVRLFPILFPPLGPVMTAPGHNHRRLTTPVAGLALMCVAPNLR